MTSPKILVAGVGNIFLGDDAFGCEVIRRIVQRPVPENVRIEDFGIRGFDLAYALMEDYDAVVLVDAVPRGEAPGTLYIIEPDISALDGASAEEMMVETHGMNPMKVLAMVRAMGGPPTRIFLVGCEPSGMAGQEERMGLSEPVEAALGEAVEMVECLIRKLINAPHSVAAG